MAIGACEGDAVAAVPMPAEDVIDKALSDEAEPKRQLDWCGGRAGV
jgi:hypothetical protein